MSRLAILLNILAIGLLCRLCYVWGFSDGYTIGYNEGKVESTVYVPCETVTAKVSVCRQIRVLNAGKIKI